MFNELFTSSESSPQVQLAYAEAKDIWGDADESILREVIETGGTPRTDTFVKGMEDYLGEKYGLTNEDLRLLVESAAWSATPGITEKLLGAYRSVKEGLNE